MRREAADGADRLRSKPGLALCRSLSPMLLYGMDGSSGVRIRLQVYQGFSRVGVQEIMSGPSGPIN